MALPELGALTREIRLENAPTNLSRDQARLYANRLRLLNNAPQLDSFTSEEVTERLEQALFLLECAIIEREVASDSDWRSGVVRAAEILEWISIHKLTHGEVPTELLAAAAYQVAGFPAMSIGMLSKVPDGQFSLLSNFLRGDFAAVLDNVAQYWRIAPTEFPKIYDEQDILASLYLEMIRSIGFLTVSLRDGESGRSERAVVKLDKLAKVFRHSGDRYSYLLARLTAITASEYFEVSLNRSLLILHDAVGQNTKEVLTKFARNSFYSGRALLWSAQRRGVEKVSTNESFVLCTPTGSGKTTVATLAAMTSLYSQQDPLISPLVMYLTPSRALAAEVETRMSSDFKNISGNKTTITGLYGGIDWGPTDAWIDTDHPTIVICTYEKADALLRYLGPLILPRLALVVIDEAHMVDCKRSEDAGYSYFDRSRRLEHFGARLLGLQEKHSFRLIALSAVAGNSSPKIAQWIGGPESKPVSSKSRATRQMIGRLEFKQNGDFRITHAFKDGKPLAFNEGANSNVKPYVDKPFQSLPNGVSDEGPTVRMRAPTLWAAINLASEQPDGKRPTVLISITQNIKDFAQGCYEALLSWTDFKLPNYQTGDTESIAIRTQCLKIIEDYLGKDSLEYGLLELGIVLHHGKMPQVLSKHLKIAIETSAVRIVIATSTLTEGVNLPVSTILVPSLRRTNQRISTSEFANLAGRAGRPGVSTEGATLVVLDKTGRTNTSAWMDWRALEADLKTSPSNDGGDFQSDSALALLLQCVRDEWSKISSSSDDAAFDSWLEVAVGSGESSIAALDDLDAMLISLLSEVETLSEASLSDVDVEAELKRVWQHTYACVVSEEEERLRRIWLVRGKAIRKLHPDEKLRMKVYRTGLTPSSVIELSAIEGQIFEIMRSGSQYSSWDESERYSFVETLIDEIFRVQSFQPKSTGWEKVWKFRLRWWLDAKSLAVQPNRNQKSDWFDFINNAFLYRSVWGFGAVVGLSIENTETDTIARAITLDDWSLTGLPWIGFWLKDLLLTGTLDPVAAFMLERGIFLTRVEAEKHAAAYYSEETSGDPLDPRSIRDWCLLKYPTDQAVEVDSPISHQVELSFPAWQYTEKHVPVFSDSQNGYCNWRDAAGHTVASGAAPLESSNFRYFLNVDESKVVLQ